MNGMRRNRFYEILDDIHNAGYVHGEVRRWNLTMRDDGSVSIIDFDRAHRVQTWSQAEDEKKDFERLGEVLGEFDSDARKVLKAVQEIKHRKLSTKKCQW